MSTLIETLAAELEHPRELPERVANYISGHYGIDYDAIGVFLVDELPKLEDYEIDLILSPVFTPRLADQTVFADLLGSESIPREQWPGLVQQLVARPIRAKLVTADGRQHSISLRAVTVERYVYRLRLDATIPEPLFDLLDRFPAADRPLLQTIARQAVWDNTGARDILVRYLTAANDRGGYSLADALELLNLAEVRKPANLPDLLARIPGWHDALREQLDSGSGSRPFFHDDIRLLHGGQRDQRGQDDTRRSVKQTEFQFLERLQQLLAE